VLLRIIAIVACAMPLLACATITKGTTQLVAIDTPGVAGAVCTITTSSGPQTLTTPGTLTLSKGSASLPIQCSKECYVTGSSVIPSNAEAMAAGNVVFGGVIGLGVDAVSGAINKYPDQVTVAMVPDPACRQGPPPSSAPRAPPRTSSR
jgi:hypothetical protein